MFLLRSSRSSYRRNTIPYREDARPNAHSVSAYLRQAWLGRGWIQVSPLLKSAIVGRVWEVYANALEHSGAALVTSCGQRYPATHQLKLTVVDFGVGIPANVRRFHDNAPWPDANAIEWAFRRGNTTVRSETGRGVGLDLLKSFVRVNDGRLELFSENGYGLITRNTEEYHNRSTGFVGTLLNLTLICDEKYYRFTTEPALPPEPLF